MRRTAVSGLILAIALLLPLTAACGAGVVGQRAFFVSGTGGSFYSALIADALKPFCAPEEDAEPVSDAGGGWIVRFSDRLKEDEIRNRLNGWDALPIAGEKDRIYRIRTSDIRPFERENGPDLLYCCADAVRTVSDWAGTDEPANADIFEQIRLSGALELAQPDPDLLIAVLDTGVSRGHDDFVGMEILSGYDAVEKHVGVHRDLSGHGTAVLGLIAAADGICPGVRVLPVRVASAEKTIYSSDFVSGLRFAADAGARIVNLSFGGYSYSDAEYDAVRYALSKGCILIAAAGNGGEDGHGSDYCYPASYEGVIAVGSCDTAGSVSTFSQNNDSVRILAPGEQLTVPFVDEDGNSTYKRVNGTSYAAAVASGVAGLVLSVLDKGVRFEGDELLSLLARDTVPESGIGYGVIDAFYAVSHANDPQICGVVSGQTYPSKIVVRFNRGSARMDGEEFEDGDAVYENGSHLLTVSDGSVSKTVSFRLSYEPALYTVLQDGGNVSVWYTGGEATVDGVPYESGSTVSGRGCHLFVLTDASGDRKEVPLYVEPDPDGMTGAENDAVYARPVRLVFSGNGTETVNGKRVSGETILTENGTYTVRLANASKSVTKTVAFRIERGGRTLENDLPGCAVWADEENGWYAVYGKELDGLRVSRLDTGEDIRLLETGPVRRMARTSGGLLVCGEKQIVLIDPERLASEEEPDAVRVIGAGTAACAGDRIWVLSDGKVSELDSETGLLTEGIPTDASDLLTDGTDAYLFWPDSGRAENCATGRTRLLPEANENEDDYLLTADWVFGSGKAYRLQPETDSLEDARPGVLLFTYSGRALSCGDGFLYTSEAAYRLEDGLLTGHYGVTLSGLFRTGDSRYLCLEDGGIKVFPADLEMTAPLPETLYAEPVRTSAYLRSYYWYHLSDVADVAADGSRFCVLFRRTRRALVCRNGELEREIDLPFEPSHAVLDGDALCIFSAESGMLWVDGTVYAPEFAFWNAWYADGRLYVNGSRLYVLDGGSWVRTGLEAISSDGRGSVVARLTGDHLLVTDGTASASVRSAASEVWTDGKFVIADGTVYRFENGMLERWMEHGEPPIAAADGGLVSAEGLVRLESRETVPSFLVSNARFAAVSSGCGLLLYSDGDELRQCCLDDPDAGAFWAVPEPEGCADRFLYRDSTRITYAAGSGFLDGKAFPSGTVADQPGLHTFRLVLPCGLEYRSEFRIAPALSEISFLRPSYKLAVNEEGSIPVVFLPQGASSIPLFFTADSDCLELRGDGSFRAMKEGTAVLTARTEDGRFSAHCTVEVTAAVLRFDEQSGYLVDRVDGLLLNVAENTSSADLLASVLSPGRATASAERAGTGTVIALLSEDGTELDRLTVVVAGDLDGDGFVTLQDLLILEELLEEGGTDDPLLIKAGDADGSGTLTSRDVNWLRQYLLFERGPSRHETPPASEEGTSRLLVPSAVREGETIRVLIALHSCENAVGVSGRLLYDGERFTLDNVETYDWTIQVSKERSGRVAFVGTGKPADDLHPVLSVLLRVKDSDEQEPASIQLRDLVVLREGTAESLERTAAEVVPEAPVYGALNITAEGMDPFDPERTAYEISLPYDTFWVDYTLTRPEDVLVEVGCPVFVRENRLVVEFRVRDADGGEKTYTLTAYRDGTRPKKTDSRLRSLSVAGYDLDFSPDKTEYELTVPRGTKKLDLSYETADKKATAVCEGAELKTESPVVTVRVTAENGTETVYLIRIRWSEETSGEDSALSEDTPQEPGTNGWVIWVILGTVLLIGGAVTLFALRARRNRQS